MKNHSRTNLLLLELMIVVLFFMLGSTVLIRVFAKAREMSDRAEIERSALLQGQNLTDLLYAEGEMEETLARQGFLKTEEGLWSRREEGYLLFAALSEQEDAYGRMSQASVYARFAGTEGEEPFMTLSCARYEEVTAP